jgi:carbamate kinase
MLVVVALGGNALLRRGEPMEVGVQRANVGVAAAAVAEIRTRLHASFGPAAAASVVVHSMRKAFA